jgi:hypothetical protein
MVVAATTCSSRVNELAEPVQTEIPATGLS